MFNKMISVLSAAMITFSMPISAFSASVETVTCEQLAEVPPNIVFLGDSIAEGYGLEGFETDKYSCDSYANILRDKYAGELNGICSESMINDAVSGDTSQQLIDHLNKGEFDANLKDSDVVVVSIGGNDILQLFISFIINDLNVKSADDLKNIDLSFSSLMDMAKSLQKMTVDIDDALDKFDTNIVKIADIIHQKSDGILIVQTLYNPMADINIPDTLRDYIQSKIDTLNEHIIDNAADSNNKNNYLIADIAAAFNGKSKELTNIKEFDIHPNVKGHKVIADCVDNVVRSKKYLYEFQTEAYEVTPKIPITAVLAGVGTVIVLSGSVLLIIRKKRH